MSWKMNKIYFGNKVGTGTGKLNITEVGLEIRLRSMIGMSS